MAFPRKQNATVVLCLLTVAVASAAHAGDTVRIKPHLNNVTQTGITFGWETFEPSTGEVTVTAKGSDKPLVGKDAESKTVHLLRVEGLKPETEYAYNLKTAGEEFTYAFKTAPAGPRPITFVVMGDSRLWDERAAETKMIEHMLQWKPELFLNNGDLAARGRQHDSWLPHFKRFEEILPRYMMVGLRGNHEEPLSMDEDDWFGRYFELPGGDEPFSSFTWGNTHFIVVAHEYLEWPELRQKTVAWLEDNLSTPDSTWTVMCQHPPVVCTGYGPGIDPFDQRRVPVEEKRWEQALFEKHDVDMVLAGHTHIYERIYPLRDGKRDDRSGVAYVVNGGSINANFPDVYTAATDNEGLHLQMPTYSLFQCTEDTMTVRTFAYSEDQAGFVEIDRYIRWKDEAVPRGLLGRLPSLSGEERVAAIRDLGAMLYAPAVPALLEVLKGDDAEARRAAATAIRSIGNAEGATAMLAFLEDPDTHERREAARTLEIAMPADAAEAVAAQAANPEQDELARRSLLGALQFHAPAKAASRVCMAALSPETPVVVRRRAAHVLGLVAQKEDAEALIEHFMQDEETYVVQRLAVDLNRLLGEQVDPQDRGLYHARPGKYRQPFADRWRACIQPGATDEKEAAAEPEAKAIEAVMQTWITCLGNHDVAGGADALSDDFYYGAYGRNDGDKDEFLGLVEAALKEGVLKDSKTDLSGVRVQVYGNEAIYYNVRMTTGEKVSHVEYYLRKGNGAWEIVRFNSYWVGLTSDVGPAQRRP